MSETILLTGATGFTGRHVLDELIAASTPARVRVFARSEEKVRALGINTKQCEVMYGSIEDESSFTRALMGVDTLINVVSLGFGHAPEILRACSAAKVTRGVFVSTTGIYTRLNPSSKRIRLDAEAAIRDSGMRYTIIRPTMIFGTMGDRNISRLIRFIDSHTMLPIPGRGKNLLQPVFVKDLARAIVSAGHSESAVNKEYIVPGRDVFTFNEIVDTIAELLQKKCHKLHFPLAFGAGPLTLMERWGIRLPLKAEQLMRLNEDKVFPYDPACTDLGYDPIPFKEAIRAEIEEYRLASRT